jgi:hypothetical protein
MFEAGGFRLLRLIESSIRHLERAAQPEHAVRVWTRNTGQAGIRALHVEIPTAHARIQDLRLEQPHQVLEITSIAGAKLEAVIIGKAVR